MEYDEYGNKYYYALHWFKTPHIGFDLSIKSYIYQWQALREMPRTAQLWVLFSLTEVQSFMRSIIVA